MPQENEEKKTVLIVEDEEVMLNLLANKVEGAGYHVESAKDGIEGLEKIHELKPDLVLLDMMLPRLGGLSIIKKLNEEKILPAMPVVVISNSGQPVEIDTTMKLGACDYMIKVNFDPDEVVAKVNHILGMPTKTISAPMGQPRQEREPAIAAVLLLEEDVFLSELLEKKFEQARMKTFRAKDAEEAKHILENEPVDVMLIDTLVSGIDGIGFLRELKANDKFSKIPVVIISNVSRQEEVERGMAAGAASYIIKAHTTPGEIVDRVKQILNK